MGFLRQYRSAIREALASVLAANTRVRQSLGVALLLLIAIFSSPGRMAAADITSPPVGSTLGPNVTFTWSNAIPDVTEYTLGIGSQWGWHDIFYKKVGLATSQEVTGLPTNGILLYVEICSAENNGAVQCPIYPYFSAGASKLDKCSCADIPQLQDRLQKLKGVEALVANRAASAAGKPASQHEWAALQAQIRDLMIALQVQNLTRFSDTSLFSGKDEPGCIEVLSSGASCMEQDYILHQLSHQASCQADRWQWQRPWDEMSMLGEEATALEKEVSAIQETIKQLSCSLPPGSVTATAQPPPVQTKPSGPCPQFMVTVQNVTTSSINMSGLTGQSGRSLNNGQGINVPLVFHPDGTFEGFGAGTDAGGAAGAIPGETVHSQFGHMQAVQASGFVRPGDCATKPCKPDVMHLVLVGGPSQQMTQAQARGQLNRDMQQTTPTGGARLEFDLPAYIGGSAQRTFFASAMLNSYMTVTLVQGNNGTPALPAGSSVLYSLQQCSPVGRSPSGGGGAAGVVIPGVEAVSAATPSKSGGSGPNQNVPGVVIPGLEGMPVKPTSKPASSGQNTNIGLIIPGLDTGTNTNAAPAPHERPASPPPSAPAGNMKVAVSESLQVSDLATAPSSHVIVAVNESIQAGDTVNPPAPHVIVKVNESLQASDAIKPINNGVAVNVNEAIQIADNPLMPVDLSVNENIQISDNPVPPVTISINESINLSDADAPSAVSQSQTKPVKQPLIR